jgi:ribosomal protein S8
MEHTDKSQKTINNLSDKELQEIMSDTDVFKATIEAVIKEKPEFKKMSLVELKDNHEFQQIFKRNIIENQPSAKAELPETMEVLKSVIPKRHVKPNNKLANKMTKNLIDEGEIELIVSGKKTKKEVYTKVMLAYDERYVQLSGREKYTPYDREVYDGVVTLYEAGNDLITPAMVYRAMNGLTEREFVSEQAIESVSKSLDKSMFIKITIDYTEEAKLYNKNVEETHYMGNLLNAGKIFANIKGKKQEAYKLYRKPILYEYAQVSGQIITVPNKLLQTKDAVRSTDEVIVIRGYLLRQIEWIKNEKTKRSENIIYKGIYNELEITRDFYDEIPYKKKTAKVRRHVKSILEEWQEQGYIKKHEEYKEGQTIKGITIII